MTAKEPTTAVDLESSIPFSCIYSKGTMQRRVRFLTAAATIVLLIGVAGVAKGDNGDPVILGQDNNEMGTTRVKIRWVPPF
jgi:hypothetical protein